MFAQYHTCIIYLLHINANNDAQEYDVPKAFFLAGIRRLGLPCRGFSTAKARDLQGSKLRLWAQKFVLRRRRHFDLPCLDDLLRDAGMPALSPGKVSNETGKFEL